MDPVTLLVVGGGAILLLLKKGSSPPRPPEQKQESPPPPPQPSALAQQSTTSPEDFLGELGKSLGLPVGAALAFGAFGAKVGKAITGDTPGEVVGFINPVVGTGFNVGREIGQEADKIVSGGTGTQLSSTIAQVGVGGAIALTLILGPLIVFFAVGFAINAVLAYLIGIGIGDAQRLSYGQTGAQRDYDKAWAGAFGKCYQKLRDAGLSDAQAIRFAYPFADGFMVQLNLIAFRQWMKRGRGFLSLNINVPDTEHARYGEVRGYFVGKPVGEALSIGPDLKSLSDPEYRLKAEIPPGDLTAVTRPVPVDIGASDIHSDSAECQLMRSKGQDKPTSLGHSLYRNKCVTRVLGPRYEDRTFYEDPKRRAYQALGEYAGRIMAYVQWMRETRGAFVSDERHAEYGVAEGRFEGTVVKGGGGTVVIKAARLEADGQTVTLVDEVADWRKYEAASV